MVFIACEKKYIYPDDVKEKEKTDSLYNLKVDSLDRINDSLTAVQMRALNKFKNGPTEIYYFPLENFTHSLEVFMYTHPDLEYVDDITIYNDIKNGYGQRFLYVEGYNIVFRKCNIEK